MLCCMAFWHGTLTLYYQVGFSHQHTHTRPQGVPYTFTLTPHIRTHTHTSLGGGGGGLDSYFCVSVEVLLCSIVTRHYRVWWGVGAGWWCRVVVQGVGAGWWWCGDVCSPCGAQATMAFLVSSTSSSPPPTGGSVARDSVQQRLLMGNLLNNHLS